MGRHVQRLVFSLFVLAAFILLLPAPAAAVRLENDVDVNWTVLVPLDCPADPNCPSVVIDGIPRLVPDASDNGDAVLFDLVVDVNVFDLILGLKVYDELGTQLPVLLGPFDVPLTSDDPMFLHFTLGDFPNFDTLPDDVPLIFSLITFVQGTNNLNGGPAAIISVSGEGTPVRDVGEVPEPATLVLVGTGIAAIVRRRVRKAGLEQRPPIA